MNLAVPLAGLQLNYYKFNTRTRCTVRRAVVPVSQSVSQSAVSGGLLQRADRSTDRPTDNPTPAKVDRGVVEDEEEARAASDI